MFLDTVLEFIRIVMTYTRQRSKMKLKYLRYVYLNLSTKYRYRIIQGLCFQYDRTAIRSNRGNQAQILFSLESNIRKQVYVAHEYEYLLSYGEV